jgi:hypothetical protein
LRKSSEEQLGAVFQYLKYISPGSFELTESGELIVDEDRMTPGQMTTLLNLLVEPEEAAPVKSTPPVKKARGKKAEKTTTVRKKREVVKPPETEEEFRALLQENKQATARSLIELQNELRRMAGRRPMTDYTPRGEDFSEYQVNVEELAQQLAKAQIPEEDDSDSDTVSSDEEAPLLPIEQRPVEKRPAVEKQPAVEKRAANGRDRKKSGGVQWKSSGHCLL